MRSASLSKNITYKEKNPAVEVLLSTESGKEIRIAFKKDQVMARHQTPFPIVIEIFEGSINFGFGVDKKERVLHRGDLIALEGSVPHDLTALEDSVIRLSLNKRDSTKRFANLRRKE